MTSLPAIPTRNAPLPETYEAARQALAECSRVDECKEWSDRAQALASYARQADDDTLHKLARRIQARAVRRAGELLRTFQNPHKGLNTSSNGSVTTGPRSQREAAEEAGMSLRQERTAVRVSRVPDDDFEAAVESEDPPTVTALAENGKRPAPTPEPEKPDGFYDATHVVAAMRRFAERCEEHTPEYIAAGLTPGEHPEARSLVRQIDAWLDRFVVNLTP